MSSRARGTGGVGGRRGEGGRGASCACADPTSPFPRYLVIDLGFAIEAREEDSLPEALCATVRLSRMDINRTIIVPADAGDMVLGGAGVH